MKETEYGGSDTKNTHGIFPAPHVKQPHEVKRLLAQTDPADPESGNDIVGEFS